MNRIKSWFTVVGVVVAIGLSAWATLRSGSADPVKPPEPPPVPENVIVAPVGEMTRVDRPASEAQVVWITPESQKDRLQVIEYPNHAILCPRVAGTYDFGFVSINGDKSAAKWWIVRSGKGPQPPPPDPVKPPEPKPDVSPIAAPGLHVLIVYDRKKSLTEGQKKIIFGQSARTFLDTNTATDSNGHKAYRIWPPETDASKEAKVWQEAFARPRNGDPWIVVGNSAFGGYEGPLPETEAEFVALCTKYKGK